MTFLTYSRILHHMFEICRCFGARPRIVCVKSGKGPPLGRVTQRNQERCNDLVRAPLLPNK